MKREDENGNCLNCIDAHGLCSYHARHIADLAEIDWRKLIASSEALASTENPRNVRDRQRYLREQRLALINRRLAFIRSITSGPQSSLRGAA